MVFTCFSRVLSLKKQLNDLFVIEQLFLRRDKCFWYNATTGLGSTVRVAAGVLDHFKTLLVDSSFTAHGRVMCLCWIFGLLQERSNHEC